MEGAGAWLDRSEARVRGWLSGSEAEARRQVTSRRVRQTVRQAGTQRKAASVSMKNHRHNKFSKRPGNQGA